MQGNMSELKTIDIFKLKKEDFNFNCNVDKLLEKLNSENDYTLNELIEMNDVEFDLLYKVISHYSNIFKTFTTSEDYINSIKDKKEKLLLQKAVSISASNSFKRELDSLKTKTNINSLNVLY